MRQLPGYIMAPLKNISDRLNGFDASKLSDVGRNVHENGVGKLVVSTLVAGNNRATTARIRDLLVRRGLRCPDENVVPLKLATDRALRQLPELIVVELSHDPRPALRTIAELAATGGACVVALGSASDPQLILKTLHSGADVYVDENELESELTEAIVRFKNSRSTDRELPKGGKMIAVLAASGGAGSSFLAANLAVAFAQERRDVCMVDLRSTAGDLAAMLDVHPTYTLADLCDNLARLDAAMFSQVLLKHHSGVKLLASPQSLRHARRVTAKGVGAVLAHARRQFEYTFVDLDNSLGLEQVEALWQANEILLIVRLDYIALRNAQQRIEDLKQLGLQLPRLRLVANRYRRRRTLSVREAERALRMTVSHFIPEDAARVLRSINTGTPLLDSCPRARITRQIEKLAVTILAEHSEHGGNRPPSLQMGATPWKKGRSTLHLF